jgi:uncharacterized protein (DUF1501 family)
MGKTTRREFIKKSGFTLVTVGVSGRAFSKHLNLAANSALTAAAAQSTTGKILVVIQLAGGNDGINTLIPMSGTLNSIYRQRRPTLAVPQEQILPLPTTDAAGNQLGFHPRLAKMKSLFDQGRVAVLQSVGYANSNRSHFESMDIWHTADPTRRERAGWLGEYFDASAPSSENPLLGVYIGGLLPLGMRGEEVVVPAIGNTESYRFMTDERYAVAGSTNAALRGEYNNRVQTFLALNRELAPERQYWNLVGQTAGDAYQSSVTFQTGIAQYPADSSIQYPNTGLGRALRTVAQIIGGGLETKILYVTQGGYDTHQGQNGVGGQGGQPNLLQTLDDAVDMFYRDMQRLGKADNVLIMTWSEFGRKVGENGNLGTDHGNSAPQLVIGSQVKSGIIGEFPSLTNLDRDDGTIYSIDFRRYYATILEKWLGVDSTEILDGSFELLPFI